MRYTPSFESNMLFALPAAYLQYIWEAVSHEVGHTLGLLHDGMTHLKATCYFVFLPLICSTSGRQCPMRWATR
jgi:hypothetical protein